MEILLLILGWLFGLLSPAIVDAIRDRRDRKVVKGVLLSELHELRYRLMMHVYQVESKYGNLNHEFFEWAQSVLTEYKGINSSESLLNTIGPLLKLSSEEMATYSQMARAHRQSHGGLSLRKHSLAMMDANIKSIGSFDPVFRGRILEIKTRLEFLNEIIDDARYYFQLSFQNGITPENYQIANANLIQTYKFYAARAKDIIGIIGKVSK